MNDQQDLYNAATQLHQSGRIPEAIELYLKILQADGNNAQVLYLLGSAHMQIGQLESGARHLEHSLDLNPDNAGAHNNLGIILHNLKRMDEALAAFDRTLALNPDDADTYNNRGNVLRGLRRLDEALASYDKTISLNPNYAQAHSNRGVVLRDLMRLNEALVAFDTALELIPDDADTYNNRGNVLRSLDQKNEALASFDKALKLNPDHAEAHRNRGMILLDINRPEGALKSFDMALEQRADDAAAYNYRGIALVQLARLDDALASFAKAIALNPESAEAHINHGNVLNEFKRSDEALASFDKAVELRPDSPEAHNNRGVALRELMQLDSAVASFDKALELGSIEVEAYNNRGVALKDMKRLDEAMASFDKALEFEPNHAKSHWNKSLLLILLGRYLEGWELYEWRLKKRGARVISQAASKPAWRGEDNIRGKKLLVYAEQGLGDILQFCRYLPQIQSMGAEIIFEVPKSLAPLISTMDCPMTVIARDSSLPAFDAYCPVMSLPHAFKTTVETIPAETPYLYSDKTKVEQWQQKLGPKKKMRVGLVWSGSARNRYNANRSIRLEEFLPVLDLPVEWYSLQNEFAPHDLEFLNAHPEIQQCHEELTDFAEIAAFIECLDLLISVDTSFVHVAGAIGCPVWVLLPFAPDYRWMLDREDSPWYPTTKLFRQAEVNDWQSVISKVAENLPS